MKNEPTHKDQAVRLPNQFPNDEKILLTMPIYLKQHYVRFAKIF